MRKYFVVFILLILSANVFGRNNITIDDSHAKYSGFSLTQVVNGSGFGGYFEKFVGKTSRIGIEAIFIMNKGENDYPVYNYYLGQFVERNDKKRLNFLKLTGYYKKMLFTNQIANNFRPFLSAGAGPVIAFDPPNIPDFVERFKNIKVYYTYRGTFGCGVDFLYGPQTAISFYAGYEYIKFANNMDPDERKYSGEEGYDNGKKNFSGMVVGINIGKKF